MQTIIRAILERCPTHGFCTDAAHAAGCKNQDHLDLLELFDSNGNLTVEIHCNCPTEIDAECPECECRFTVYTDAE